MIYFVGAGPGAVDLITVRGQKLLEEIPPVVQIVEKENPRIVVPRYGTGRIAVICPDNLIAPVRDAVRRKLAVILDPAEYARLIEQPEWDEQISVCGTETVKGLEFDAVVVVEPGLIEDDAPSRLVAASDLYVAMTRPTQKLVIVRTKADEKSLNI